MKTITVFSYNLLILKICLANIQSAYFALNPHSCDTTPSHKCTNTGVPEGCAISSIFSIYSRNTCSSCLEPKHLKCKLSCLRTFFITAKKNGQKKKPTVLLKNPRRFPTLNGV